MSINVTVTGNPINVQKGRMVTVSPNRSKKEFEKRRLIRLSQVRQQSKSIAEDVRNRVRREKLKQVEEIEKEGQKKLKQWQARKLLDLQNQYHEALKDIGTGHKEASLLENENDLTLEQKAIASQSAKQRGSIATKILHEEKEKVKVAQENQMGHKRSNVSASLGQSGSSKRRSEEASHTPEISAIVTESNSECDRDEISTNLSVKPENECHEPCESLRNSNENIVSKLIEEIPVVNVKEEPHKKDVSSITIADDDDQLLKELRDQKETRITDRIRRRSSHQLINPDVCDSHAPNAQGKIPANRNVSTTDGGHQGHRPFVQQNVYSCSCSQQIPCVCHIYPVPRISKSGVSDINQVRCNEFTDEEDSLRKKISIDKDVDEDFCGLKKLKMRCVPRKPKVTLKSLRSPIKNRCSSSAAQANIVKTQVEKIPEENLIISPDPVIDVDFRERDLQRDREAYLRGKKAMERDKLQREYNELMKKLPVLQKLERLYEMNQDKPEYHMTEERLEEQERKKQNILGNTYEKLFPDRQPSVVTIPKKDVFRKDLDKKEETATSDDATVLNLGSWGQNKKSGRFYTEEEVEAMLRGERMSNQSKLRSDELKSVLVKLRRQKEELIKEIQKLSDEPVSFSEKLRSKETKAYSPDSTDTRKSLNKKRHESAKQVAKKASSIKFGLNSVINSSSSYETVEEQIESQPMSVKKSKVISKGVQVSQISHKRKSSSKNKKELPNIRNSEKVAKKQKSDGEVVDAKESTVPNEVLPLKSCVQTETQAPPVPFNSLVSVNEPTEKAPSSEKVTVPIINCDCKSHNNKTELCEIVIKIKEGKSSEVLIKDKTESKNKEKDSRTSKIDQKSCRDHRSITDKNKIASWHEKFTRNNSHGSNSSTSYLSPPHLPNKTEAESRVTPYFCDLIGKKPQQQNLSDDSFPSRLESESANKIREEIEKLLKMSRRSVDELGVSSVSTVTTPSQSIIDMESNKENFNFTHSYTTTHNTVTSNVSSNDRTDLPSFSMITLTSDTKTVEKYPNILEKYAKIADQCSQRISNLSAMIEKVRDEKNRMLQSPSILNKNDSSTRYLDLPPSPKKSVEEANLKYDHNKDNSGTDDVLEINTDFAEKLKGLTKKEIQELLGKFDETPNDTGNNDSLTERFKALKEPITNPHTSGNPKDVIDFTPLLLDIPKMPPLSAEPINSKRRKPPPSKGIIAARKFTNFTAPHELSTIPEQESQTKLENILNTTKNDETKRRLSESTPKTDIKVPETTSIAQKITPLHISDNSLGSTNTSGDEKIEMFRIEAMLRSIGMDWAISTVRKTQEALALTSSSSSLELKSPATLKQYSEDDVKKYLKKQMFQKISSSTLKSDASPGSLNESHELSEIQNANFTNKQTSTPVDRSRESLKSHEKSSNLASAIESEIESKQFFSLSGHSV